MASEDRGVRRRILLQRLGLGLLLIPVIGLALSGCAGRMAATVNNRSYATPEAALRAISIAPTPADASVTATARIEINHKEGHHSLKVALMLRKPSWMRVESIPLLGPPDFLLSIARDELRVFLPGQGKGEFYIGRATPQNISRFLPLPLPPEEVVSLLLGEAWPPAGEAVTPSFSLRGEQEDRFYRLDQFWAGGALFRSLWIDPTTDFLVKIKTFDGSGGMGYTADYAEPAQVGKRLLPQAIVLSGASFARLALRYSSLEMITEDNREDFPLSVPEGIVPVSLD